MDCRSWVKLPGSVPEPLDLLRLKWCSETLSNGGKGTGLEEDKG